MKLNDIFQENSASFGPSTKVNLARMVPQYDETAGWWKNDGTNYSYVFISQSNINMGSCICLIRFKWTAN